MLTIPRDATFGLLAGVLKLPVERQVISSRGHCRRCTLVDWEAVVARPLGLFSEKASPLILTVRDFRQFATTIWKADVDFPIVWWEYPNDASAWHFTWYLLSSCAIF